MALDRSLRIGLCVTALLALASCASDTQRQAPGDPSLIQEVDRNADGSITINEWRSWSEREFDRLDRDQDGALEPDEIGSDNLTVSREQYLDAQDERFQSLDFDDNNVLDPDEYRVTLFRF